MEISTILISILVAQCAQTFGQPRDPKHMKEDLTKARAKIEEWEATSVERAKGVSNPFLVPPLNNPDEHPKSYTWIMEYDSPFETGELFIIIIIPFVLGRVIHYLMKQFRPGIKHRLENVSEFPLIPLAYLQATAGERQMKKEKRNGLHWLAGKHIVKASDEFVNLNIGGKNYQKIMKVKKKPWRLVKKIGAFLSWARRAEKRLDFVRQGKPVPDNLKFKAERRPTIYNILRDQEVKRREKVKRGEKESMSGTSVSVGGSLAAGSFFNPGVSRITTPGIIDTKKKAKKPTPKKDKPPTSRGRK